MLGEVARGANRLEPFSTQDIAEAQVIIERYTGFGDIGLAEASNVVLAKRYGTRDILTLDERHFRAIHGPQGHPFRLLPADLYPLTSILLYQRFGLSWSGFLRLDFSWSNVAAKAAWFEVV